tara:strand:+ start:4038 stop:6524 length:2487 start_codon:yes stop_codon:yes gene_type:complete
MYAIKKIENVSNVVLDFKVSGIIKTDKIEDVNTGVKEIEHTLLSEINIDKKSLILKNIKKAELYICKLSADEISQRAPQNASSESNNQFNESVINSNLYRLNKLKTHFGMSDISKEDFLFLDEVDLSLNLNKSTINKVKSRRISDADAFGTIEKYKIVDNNSNKITDNAETKLKKNYFKYIDNINRENNIQNYNYQHVIKNLKVAGIDVLGNNTSGLGKYIEQEKNAASFQQNISGNFNKIFYKSNRHQTYNNLLNKIKSDHLNASQEYFEDTNQKKLSIVKEVNRYENVKKQFTFNNTILDGSAASLFLVLYDSKGIKSEVSIIDFDINSLVSSFKYPDFDYEFSVSKQDGRKIIGNIYNNENIQRNYVITYQTLGENNLNIYNKSVINNELSNKKIISVPAKSSKYFTLISNCKNKNYLFYARLQYGGKIYGNVKYARCNKNKSNTMPRSSFIDFHCQNIINGIEVKIRKNIYDNDVASFIVHKRNLTKKQKNFQMIGRVISNSSNNFTYLDFDLEDKNVYEYKVSKINLKGLSQMSSNSFIEKYCLNKNLGTLKVNVSKTSETISQTDFSLNIDFIKKENENDKLIKALTGNFFSLFENVLTEINQDSGIIIDAVITAYDHVLGETLNIDIVTLIDNKASVNFSLPQSIYTIKVSTRIELPANLLEAIGSAQQTGIINNDTFLDKETGNTFYSYQNTLSISNDMKNIKPSQAQVNLVKSTLQKESNQKKEKNFFNYFEAFFSIEGYYNLDYMIMSYVENNYTPVIYGLGYVPRVNQEQQTLSSISNYSFLYKIPAMKGNVAFLAQPVFIDGSLGTPFVIGNFLRE